MSSPLLGGILVRRLFGCISDHLPGTTAATVWCSVLSLSLPAASSTIQRGQGFLKMTSPPTPTEEGIPTESRVSPGRAQSSVMAPEEPSSAWDWGNFLDFSVDDPSSSILLWDSEAPVEDLSVSVGPQAERSDSPPTRSVHERVRKRDPRLTCENFLAGRVPCACPELDEKEEEEEEDGIGRKRVRMGSAAAIFRCQIAGCEVDISELKGYHRRHRVCLRCANASSVVIDGQQKRYCQQCGKFHVLPDFDEGKRSCRRKLERHNNRRRRKSADVKSGVEKESPGNVQPDVAFDNEVAKDFETSLEAEDQPGSPFSPLPCSQNGQSNSDMSFSISAKSQKVEKFNSKSTISASVCDNKSLYSSACPTGRISFKLYDWNPAEFPRRLRHQIFQWLSSMPVELEGYIRPGCTILTLFIAMPQLMWKKLHEDGPSYLKDLVHSPGSLLSNRGSMHIHLNNMLFQVLSDGTSLMSIKMEVRVPRLHYIYPNCFEAGKPISFVACGSYLNQSKFRLLVSFAGKYLVHDACVFISQGKTSSSIARAGDSGDWSEHEMFRVNIPHSQSNLFGPAFIEVENESGLSNFIPVLLGDKQVCSELQWIQRQFDEPLCSTNARNLVENQSSSNVQFCELLALRQDKISDLLLDIAWLLKEPEHADNETYPPSAQLKRLNTLLDFLIQSNSVVFLERVLQSVEGRICADVFSSSGCRISCSEMTWLQQHVKQARTILHQRVSHYETSLPDAAEAVAQEPLPPAARKENMLCAASCSDEDLETAKTDGSKGAAGAASLRGDLITPLIDREVVDVNYPHPFTGFDPPMRACGRIFSATIRGTRLLLFSVAFFGVCFGLCAAIQHPHKVGELAFTVRSCLFRGWKSVN